ncbi:MAG: hypothetical protein KIT16_08200 [Rhodospirillaceae bacterium]|nr:hypothetical protein [Rhodospirillaceae bacterium]
MRHVLTLAAALAAGLAAAPAFAQSGTYTGPNGGTATWSHGCGPYGRACARTWTATGPNGQTYNGGATWRRTPYGGAVTNRYVQGPNGNVFYGRRRW